MMLLKTLSLLLLLLIKVTNLNAQQLTWKEIHPGVWKTTIGRPDSLTLLKAANCKPNEKAMAALPAGQFPIVPDQIAAEVVDQKTYLRFPLSKEEQLFGLGLNFQTVNQRGRTMTLKVDHYGGVDNGRTHAPVPFYVSSKGYGVLIDAARYITVYAGTGVRTNASLPAQVRDRNADRDWDAQPYSDAVEILVPANGADIYVFAGPTPLLAVQRYNLLNGGGYLPPKWGLGFTQRVPTLYTQDDIIQEAKSFKQHQFPLDFIGVEPGWHSKSYPCTFEWDTNRFPRPKSFIDTLMKMNVRTNLWLNPYVSPVSSLFDKVKNLSGSHTVWNGVVPDITLPQVHEAYKNHFVSKHLNIGVSGYKIDETDGFDFWLWPDVARFPSRHSGEQMRQVYGLMMQKITAEWFKELNQRTYGLSRASNAGASSFPYVIYNDYYSHRDFITALVNSSFIGVLWTPEVRTSETAEEWVRRMQSVCFSPMAMINAWADGTKPWTYPTVEKEVREVANLRMQLLPYIYTSFAQYHFEGKPPFRAMNLVEGFGFPANVTSGELNSGTNPYAMSQHIDCKDQYMVGNYLLVAPMFAGEKSRKVLLPAGKWYDFYTGEFAGEDQWIVAKHGLDKIPLYVKDGGIIPMIDAGLHAPLPQDRPKLTIRHYGEKEGSFKLYDDDGQTFNYEKGEYSYTLLTVTKGKTGWKGKMTRTKGKPFHYANEEKWVYMSAK